MNRFAAIAERIAEDLPGEFERGALFDSIRPRDMVTIITPHGSKMTGRVVMRGPYGWVLNLGGRHGTPGIATAENVIAVRGNKGGRLPPVVKPSWDPHGRKDLPEMRE